MSITLNRCLGSRVTSSLELSAFRTASQIVVRCHPHRLQVYNVVRRWKLLFDLSVDELLNNGVVFAGETRGQKHVGSIYWCCIHCLVRRANISHHLYSRCPVLWLGTNEAKPQEPAIV